MSEEQDKSSLVDEFDLAGDGAASAAPDQLKLLNQKMQEVIDLNEMIEQLEADLKAANATLQNLRTKEMPEIMATIQVDSMTFGGFKFDLDTFVSGSLPKEPDSRAKAIEWLEKHDGAELITSDVEVKFARSEHEEAVKIYDFLSAQGLSAVLNSGVHAQTLQAFARRRLADGEDIDFDVLGLYHGKVVKFKSVEKKTSKKKGA